MIDRVKIGNFLRELRNEKGITQEELAEMEKMMLVKEKEFRFLGKILFVLFAVSLVVSAIAFNLDKVVFSLVTFAFVIVFSCVLIVFSKSYEK